MGGGLWNGISGLGNGISGAAMSVVNGSKHAAVAAAKEAKKASDLALKMAAMDDLRRKVALFPDPRCARHGLVASRVKIATWNIMWHYGAFHERYQTIESTLMALDADVICLQEAWEEVGGQRRNVAQMLAKALSLSHTPLHHVFAARSLLQTPRGQVHFGNAVLSKWPIAAASCTELGTEERDEEGQRLLLNCLIEGPRGLLRVHCGQWSNGPYFGGLRVKQSHGTAVAVTEFEGEATRHAAAAAAAVLSQNGDMGLKGGCQEDASQSATTSTEQADAAGPSSSAHVSSSSAHVSSSSAHHGPCVGTGPMVDGPAGGSKFVGEFAAHVVAQQVEGEKGLEEALMPAIVCLDCNAVPESDEVRMLTGKARGGVDGVVLVDAWEAAASPTDAGYTWRNDNLWAAREMVANRRIDYILCGQPTVGGRGHVSKVELFGDDVVLHTPVGALPSGMWPSDHCGILAHIRY